jgi:hypothetical protein
LLIIRLCSSISILQFLPAGHASSVLGDTVTVTISALESVVNIAAPNDLNLVTPVVAEIVHVLPLCTLPLLLVELFADVDLVRLLLGSLRVLAIVRVQRVNHLMVVGVDDADVVLTGTKVSCLTIILSRATVHQSDDILDRTLFSGRIAGNKVIAVCSGPAKGDLDGEVQLLKGGVVGADQSTPDLRVSRVRDGDL